MKLLCFLLACASVCWGQNVCQSGSVCYVSVNGNDLNDGSSWTRAFLTVGKAEATLNAGGGTIYVGCGTFPLTSTLNITKPTHLVGCGTETLGTSGQTTFAPTPGVTAINGSGTHLILEDFIVSGQTATLGTDDGIVLSGAFPVLRNVLVNDAGRRGIWANGTVQWYFENVISQYSRGDNFYFSGYATNGLCINCSGNNSVGGWGFNDDACRNNFYSDETQANFSGAVRINCAADQWFGLSVDISPVSLLLLTAASSNNYIQFNNGGVAAVITNGAPNSFNRINYFGPAGAAGWTGVEILPEKGAAASTTYSLRSGVLADGDFTAFDVTNGKYLVVYDPTASRWYFNQDVSMGYTPAGGAVNLFLGKTPAASLPACSSAYEGVVRSITDSTTNIWGATITGGGANHVLGYCDGVQWTVSGK